MNRKPLFFSIICILITCAISAYAWHGLPVMDQYPVHWDAQGKPNGFSSRNGVLFNLILFPAVSVFMTTVFYLMPKIEPLQKNLEESRSAYNTVWVLCMLLMTGVGGLIAYAYIGGEKGAELGASPRVVVIGMSLLFIGIGNVLGKVRQNFMLGIRTPWTLSSELSWEKTHRLGGRGFVLGGLLSIAVAVIAPQYAFGFFTAFVLLIAVVSFLYSYIIWKSDPNKRS
ncbi:MAG: SdpI family protein [Maricaulaceae bacterium]